MKFNLIYFTTRRGIFTHWFLLLTWIGLGLLLRLINLSTKPVWADEWATLVFSLGHSFQTVLLDRVISGAPLLNLLQLDGILRPGDVVRHLMAESTHPPLYFWITHLWLHLFWHEGLVSIWLARSLSVLFGTAAIPLSFGLGWIAFGSIRVGHVSALLMAVSPFGIYLAQEARHYTLGIFWILLSLICLSISIQHLRRAIPVPAGIVATWIVANGLAVATHYFAVLALAAEMVVLFGFWLLDGRAGLKHQSLRKTIGNSSWVRIYAAAIGTAAVSCIWLANWSSIPNNELVAWIYHGNPLAEWFQPLGRLLVWTVTMVALLPIEGTPTAIAIVSGSCLVTGLLGVIPTLKQGWQWQWQRPSTCLGLQVLGSYILAAIALLLAVTYVLGTDLTLAARYQFVYFPALGTVLAAILTVVWERSNDCGSSSEQALVSRSAVDRDRVKGKIVAIAVVVAGLCGSATVVADFAYQKPDRPDLVVPVMLATHRESHPVLIATTHKTHEQTGEMLGLAWEFRQASRQFSPQFLLAHKDTDPLTATRSLHAALAEMSGPQDLWLVNFSAPLELEGHNCAPEPEVEGGVSGYDFELYRCGDEPA